VGKGVLMTTAALVQLLAMTLLIVISGPRLFDTALSRGYRIAHGVATAVAIAVIIWRVRHLRRRPGSESEPRT
jgi:hypothetical protein